MNKTGRPEVPRDKIIQVNNRKRIDFNKPFKFIYDEWWFDMLVAIPFFLAWLVALFFKFKYRFRVINRKNLKILRKKGCITVSNHCHYFDTVFANYVVLPRALHVAVAQRNFEVPIVRRILRIYRAFPIPAKLKGLDMISPAVGKALKKRHHIHFLPEGELVVMSQTIHRFRHGAFILACQHQAPVIPMTYVIRSKKKKDGGDGGMRMFMVVGEPLEPPALNEDGSVPMDKVEAMSDAIATWMEETIKENRGGEPL
jgi:1-acyl-sn-glycerol-3-phosphate acyltransferase